MRWLVEFEAAAAHELKKAEVIDLAARLRAKQAGVPDADLAEHDHAWLDTDASGLGDLESYDWGPAGPPVGTPVQWDAARGEFVLREAT